jgi:hypothetical protein
VRDPSIVEDEAVITALYAIVGEQLAGAEWREAVRAAVLQSDDALSGAQKKKWLIQYRALHDLASVEIVRISHEIPAVLDPFIHTHH